MLGKLLSLLVASKGGAFAAAAIVAGATTVSVATTTPEIGDTVNAISAIVAPGLSLSARMEKDCERGQPVVVAQRNAADNLLRDAYHDEKERLHDLRGGKDVDHQKANEIAQKADRELRGVLTQALNDVAAQTLGREGHLKIELSEPSPTSSTGATASPTPKPSCTPKPSTSASPSPTPTATATPSATPTGSPAAEQRGRAEVASRVTLTPALQAIVTKAKADMKAIVDKAAAEIAALPPAEHGKSGEKGKPEDKEKKDEDKERGKPEEKKGEHGKPSERPGATPTSTPRR